MAAEIMENDELTRRCSQYLLLADVASAAEAFTNVPSTPEEDETLQFRLIELLEHVESRIPAHRRSYDAGKGDSIKAHGILNRGSTFYRVGEKSQMRKISSVLSSDVLDVPRGGKQKRDSRISQGKGSIEKADKRRSLVRSFSNKISSRASIEVNANLKKKSLNSWDVEELRRNSDCVTVSSTVSRDSNGFALESTNGLFVALLPRVQDVMIYDQDMAIDWVARHRLLLLLHLCIGNFSLVVTWALGIFLLFFGSSGAVEMMESTKALEIIIMGSDNATKLFNGTRDDEGGIFEGWMLTSVFMLDIWCLSAVYHLGTAYCFMSPACISIIWSEAKWTITADLLCLLAYTLSAIFVFPSPHHAIFLLSRVAATFSLLFIDALMIGNKLRYTPDKFSFMFGARNSGKGILSFAIILTGISFVLIDLERHFLLLALAGKETTWIIADNANEENKYLDFKVTSTDVLTVTYTASMVEMTVLIMRTIRSHVGAETSLLRSRFAIVSGNNKAAVTKSGRRLSIV